jgi:CheY-like chemotaxis protein
MVRGILIVDDGQDQRTVMALLLRRQGYNVLTAENGEVALEKLSRENPGLVLLPALPVGELRI